jgi:hypothetical protein
MRLLEAEPRPAQTRARVGEICREPVDPADPEIVSAFEQVDLTAFGDGRDERAFGLPVGGKVG